MPKYHVNSKGESGICRAGASDNTTSGKGCPFGGEAQHYSSAENAQKAYELSMASEMLPQGKTKTRVPDPRTETPLSAADKDAVDQESMETYKQVSENSEKPKEILSRLEYKRMDHGGFEYDEVVYDSVERERLARIWAESVYSRYDESFRESVINARLEKEKRAWEFEARYQPAKKMENDVPVRLIPTGSNIAYKINGGTQRIARIVGKPTIDSDGIVRGKIKAVGDGWEEFDANSKFDVLGIPSKKGTDNRWKELNDKAFRLSEERRKLE